MYQENEIGKCDCCGKENVLLEKAIFHYPFPCQCCSSGHSVLVRYCEDCEPEDLQKTKVLMKTEDLKRPFTFAFQIMQTEMQKTRGEKGGIYDVWASNLSMMLYCAVPEMTSERADEIAQKWLDQFFRLKKKEEK